MSSTIDRRVVEMQFDNRDFERNIKTSTESLDKLKKGLNLEESAKGLSALEKAGQKFNLDGISKAAESVTEKFSALGTMGDQALRRLTDASLNALNKMKGFIDSFTVAPISSGFQEYETQIGSIQTILSNTREAMTKAGYDDAQRLEIVNDRLDQLNHYADKTIYNFTEMTRNIGTFTAAGVELDTAVQSIQGIANLAAVSGSTSEQASRAMYQLSQAISSGTVKLMDWNSVVTAGMGGEVFQKALMRTAKTMGVTVDKTVTEVDKSGKKVRKTVKKTVEQLVEEEGSFKESLSSGWLSSEVLTATLEQFSWDFEQMAKDMGYTAANMEEGIAKAMEQKRADLLAQGYTLDEADEILQLARDATEAATKVKTLSQLLDTLREAAQSGWTQTWEYIVGNFDEAKDTLTSVSDYFGGIIERSAEARNAVMKAWHDQGGRDLLFNNDETKGPLGALWNLLYGAQNIVGLIKKEFENIFPPATGDELLSLTQKIQQATERFRAFTENSEGLERIRRIAAGAASGFGMLKDALGFVVGRFKGFRKTTGPVRDTLLDAAAGMGDFLVRFRDTLGTSEAFRTFLKSIDAGVRHVGEAASSAFVKARDALVGFLGKISESDSFAKMKDGVLGFAEEIPGAIEKARKWRETIVESIRNSDRLQRALARAKSFILGLSSSFEGMGEKIRTAVDNLLSDSGEEKSLTERIKGVAETVGNAISSWPGVIKEKAQKAWGEIYSGLRELFSGKQTGIVDAFGGALETFGEKIGRINWGKLARNILGVYSAFKVITLLGAITSFGKGISGIASGLKKLGEGIQNVVKNGITITKEEKDSLGNTILKVAASIGMLVGSIYLLAQMDEGKIATGLGVITMLAIELLTISALFDKLKTDGKSLLMLAGALTLMVVPIKLLGMMDAEQAIKGVIALGIVMTEMALFMRLAGKGFTGKTGFISMAVAINLMVVAVKNLSSLNAGSMTKSLIGMEVLLLEVSRFMKKAGKIGKVSGLIGMAVAINMLVFAVKRMGKMNTSTIAKGVLGLGGLMTAFGAMANLAKGTNIGTSVAVLLTMAGSLILFIEAFKRVEGMDTDDMLRFATSISETMLAMSVAMKVISSIPISGALTGIASFGILIAGIGGIIAALGWLQEEWSGLTGLLEGGGNVLELIGQALGGFVGGIGSGIATGLNLPQLGADLSGFMVNAQGFVAGASQIDGAVAAGVGYLSSALLAIGGAEFINAIVSLFSGENPVVKFSGDLKTLGNGLIGYAESIKGFSGAASEADINQSVNTAKGLASMVNSLPSTGGKLQSWLGWKDLGKFSLNIVLLATGLKSYATAVKGFADSGDDLKKSAETAQALADVNRALPATGGKLQDWIGTQDLSLFSTQIVELAGGLKAYAQACSGFSGILYEEDMESSAATAKALADVNRALPATGGVLQDWIGTQDLGVFATKIVELAGGLMGYAMAIKGFSGAATEADFTAAKDTAKNLSDLNNSIPATGGVLQDWIGTQDLGVFATKIVELAGGLMGYAMAIKGFSGAATEADFTAAKDTAKSLSDLNNSIPATGGVLTDWLFGGQDLGKFAGNIALLGGGLKTFADSIGGVSYTKAEDALGVMDVIRSFTEELEKTGGIFETIGNFLGGKKDIVGLSRQLGEFGINFNSFASGISQAAQARDNFSIVKEILNSFITLSSAIKEQKIDTRELEEAGWALGGCFATAMSTAISDGEDSVTGAAAGLGRAGSGAIRNSYNGWSASGSYLVQGLVNGILAMEARVRAAASRVANAASGAVNGAWRINSPSKVGYEQGMYYDLGIAGGLERYASVVSSRADSMASGVVKSAETLLRGANGSIFDNIDPNPTIRPIFDLSDVQNGIRAINGMLSTPTLDGGGMFRGMRLNRSIDSLSFDGAKLYGGLSDRNIVSRLDALSERIGALGDAVTNMQIVLDSGELVGATSAKMDGQFGVMAMRRSRGN